MCNDLKNVGILPLATPTPSTQINVNVVMPLKSHPFVFSGIICNINPLSDDFLLK